LLHGVDFWDWGALRTVDYPMFRQSLHLPLSGWQLDIYITQHFLFGFPKLNGMLVFPGVALLFILGL